MAALELAAKFAGIVMQPIVLNAIARIDVIQQGRVISRGTGFLVGDGLVLTALHVVADRNEPSLSPYPGEIVLTFPTLRTKALIHENYWDRLSDWAMLRCESSPPDSSPLPLAELREDAEHWETYGFPDANPGGMVITGRVSNYQGNLEGRPVFQLFSPEAAAGQGAPVKGLSGGPVLVQNAVVGLLRVALMKEKEGQSVAGTVYACPVASILEKTGDLLPLPDPCFGLPGLPNQPLPNEPFRYLAWFTAKEAEVFFGRNREIRQMYELLTAEGTRLMLLFGQSGVGKSSFLDAGLVPRLRWRHEVEYIRRDANSTLLQTLLRNLQSPAEQNANPTRALREIWKSAEQNKGKPLVIFFDQIEEIYIHPNKERADELEELCTELKSVSGGSNPPQGRLVLCFRKEWFTEIQKQMDVNGLSYGKMYLEGLDRKSITEVVKGLTQTRHLQDFYGLTVDPDLPEFIAQDLVADRGSPIAPTLQILLTRMWERAIAQNRHAPKFSLDLYQSLKQDGLLLKDFLDRQFEALKAKRAEWIESGLALDLLAFHTTPLLSSTERNLDEVIERYGDFRKEEIGELLLEMKNLYLLSDQSADKEKHATRLIHETLAPLVRQRFDQSEKPGQRARRILESRIAEWNEGSESGLLDEGSLKAVESGASGMRVLTEKERKLMDASRKQQRIRQRNRKALFGLAFAAVLLIAISAVLAGVQARNATRQKNIADANLQLARKAVDESLSSAERQQARDAPDPPQLEQFRQQLLNKAELFYSTFLVKQSNNDPQFRAESALVYSKLGDINRLLGKRQQAVDQYQSAISGLEELNREKPRDTEFRQALAYAHNGLGETLRIWSEDDPSASEKAEKQSEAAQEYDRALALQGDLHGELPGNAEVQQELARTYDNRGILRSDRKDAKDAESDFNQAIGLLEPLANREQTPQTAETENPASHDLVLVYNNLSILLIGQNQMEKAQDLSERAIRLQQQLIKTDSENWGYREELSTFQNNLAFLALQTGGRNMAKQLNLSALDGIEDLATPPGPMETQRAKAHMFYQYLGPSDHPEFHGLYVHLADEYKDLASQFLADGDSYAARLATQSLGRALPDIAEPDRTRLEKSYRDFLKELAGKEKEN